MRTICVVCESGWIIVGQEKGIENGIELTESSVVRRWTNGRGIGGIAKAEYKDEYTLDPIGDVIINPDKVLFTIPCEW